ncbi:hypothetical protein HCU01_24350 [Halomonas cupida]|uniref:Uncharacterized protein n=1 Tax=Halomonas cupida TaxID=44933 RepID=A0A1M7JTE5_9GAMM|nr:hypothetical protein HCU01_24350 [Halomonas cupida]SHM56264.1 hypothetical protein SAMN05660971_03301 [Halomonas cupida]
MRIFRPNRICQLTYLSKRSEIRLEKLSGATDPSNREDRRFPAEFTRKIDGR